MDDQTIEYKSPNGFCGRLYGKSSLIIYLPDGELRFHTGFRNINTYEELKEMVDDFPAFEKNLSRLLRADPESEDKG